jgi:hypothetical protein
VKDDGFRTEKTVTITYTYTTTNQIKNYKITRHINLTKVLVVEF